MFELDISPHDMFSISISNPTKEVRDFLRGIVANQWIDSEDYKQSQKAGAFLQCDYPDYILIEFWHGDNSQNFVDYANKKWENRDNG